MRIRTLLMGCVVVASASLGVLPAKPAENTKDARRRPNILVIVTDDQRADSLRYMPATKRWFRRGGTTFENAFATTPVCCPSRASILTGRYAHNHGVMTASDTENPDAERAESMMIQRRLQRHGYRTAIYGKYLNNWDLSRSPRAFDRWAIFAHSEPDGYRGGLWNVNGRLRRIERYSTTYLRKRAVAFITAQEQVDGRPWFVYLAPAAPHSPFDSERRYRRAPVTPWNGNPAVEESDRSDKPAWVQLRNNGAGRAGRIREKQLRTLMSVDDLVRDISRIVRKLGEERRTLAIYTSDNGFLWGEHGLGTKRWPYLQSPKIPLFLRWPQDVAEGERDARLVANIDIAPTIADVARVRLDSADGRSLLSAGSRERLLLEYFRSGDVNPPSWASTLTPSFQYVEYYDENAVLITREYYDLLADPWQLTNLFGDLDLTNDPLPTEAAELALQLRDDRACRGADDCP